MSVKSFIRRAAKFVLESQPEFETTVKIDQVNYGGILKDYNIVITGGSGGIGYAMAEKFIHEGAKVIISGRTEKKLKSAIDKLGVNSSYIVSDVSDVKKSNQFLDKCEKEFGNDIDCLVSNAGVSFHEGNIKNVSVSGFDEQFNINLRGAYFLAKSFIERKENRVNSNSQLLFITSETGDQVYDIPYGMTKASLNSLIGALSRRVYKKGIRVNGIAPGVTLSDMTKSYADLGKNKFMNNAAGRILLPEEIAEVACFLLSGASQCISGEIIHCNAGNHLKTFWE